MAEGRGGVVKKFLDHTTPSARTNEASRLFLIVQTPLLPLRRGASLQPSDFGGVFGHTPEHQESGAQDDSNPCYSDGQASERKVLAKENRVDKFNQSHHGIQSIERD